jgi:hypothetical protein
MEKPPGTSERPRDRLRRLYRLMSARRFVAHRDELIALGFSGRQIDSWIRNGRLIKVLRAVYSFGRDIETREAVWRAAILVAGEGSALIGRSACEAWGMVSYRDGIPALVEVGSPSGQARKVRGVSPALRGTVVRIFRRHFGPGDFRQRNGLILASPALALVDFAASASARDVRFAFLEACRLKLFRERDVEYCHRLLFCRSGAGKLRPFLTLWVPELDRIKSVLEGWFILVWAKRKLPMPKVNWKVFGKEVDFYFSEFDLVVELDGDAFHSDPVQKQIDAEKQRYLESRGLKVLRATFKEFAVDPEGFVDRVIEHQTRKHLG